jgi:hypothetical protein
LGLQEKDEGMFLVLFDFSGSFASCRSPAAPSRAVFFAFRPGNNVLLNQDCARLLKILSDFGRGWTILTDVPNL